MPSTGAWIAVDPENTSAAQLFSSEIQAFRAANGTPMVVKPWPFGKSLTEVIAGEKVPK